MRGVCVFVLGVLVIFFGGGVVGWGFMPGAGSFDFVSLPSAGSHAVRNIVAFFYALVTNSGV